MNRVNHVDLLNVITYLSIFDEDVLGKIHCDGQDGVVKIFVDPKVIPPEDLEIILDCNTYIDEEGFFVVNTELIE